MSRDKAMRIDGRGVNKRRNAPKGQTSTMSMMRRMKETERQALGMTEAEYKVHQKNRYRQKNDRIMRRLEKNHD